MNFRFFDDLVGSAPGASQEGKHLAKIYSAKTIEIFLENLHKILKISKNFQIYLVKLKKKFENVLLIFKLFSENLEHFE